ncbi:MAG: tol-pal system YbgF family protein [Elusimicrobiales bacterium]
MRILAAILALSCIAALGYSPLAAQQYIDPEEESAELQLPGEEKPAAEQPSAEKPAPRPAATPAVIQPTLSPAETLKKHEWEFLNSSAVAADEDALKLLLPHLEDWLAANPEHSAAAEALLLKAGVQYKLGDHKSALVSLLRQLQAYPEADSSERARRLFGEILAKKADKKLRPVLADAAEQPEVSAPELNVSLLLEKLAAEAGEEYYEPLAAEFRSFFARFPGYARNDAVRLSLADLHRLNGEYSAARLAYEKAIALHPASPLLARAKLSLANLLADNLKAYDRAIAAYQDIAASFPGTDEAWAAYGRLPALAERQKKYALAVETDEKIIALYPDKPEAYQAYRAAARVLREDLKKPQEAIAVLGRLADKYKNDAVIEEALLPAAEIYRKDLKDSAGEVGVYERIAAEYQKNPQAPKALYAAGEIFFKVKDGDRARVYYQKVMELYPEDPMSKKAEARLSAIIAGKI